MSVALSPVPALAKNELGAGLVEVRERFELAQIERGLLFGVLDFGIRACEDEIPREGEK